MKRISKQLPVAAAFLGGSVLLLSGCSGRPDPVEQADFASGAGGAAVDAYDANGDDAIAGAELDRVPGLRASLEQVDTDGDGRLTADEIDARIQSWRDSRTGEMTATCHVTLDGEALDDAQVVFEPESFLGSDVKPATGATGADGSANLSMAADHLSDSKFPGMGCGWYKIRVTSNSHEIPARYNTETTLGCEVAPDADWVYDDNLLLELKSN